MTQAIHTVHLLIGLLGLYLLWHVGVHPYLLDKFRADLFELRDRLFDYARDGYISFDDEYYRSLRNWYNATIRSAHRINLFDSVVIWLFVPSPKSEETRREMERLGELVRGKRGKELQEMAVQLWIVVGKYFVMRSPLMWIVFPAGVVVGFLRDTIRSIRRSRRQVEATYAWLGRHTEKQVSYAEVEVRSSNHNGVTQKPALHL